MLPIGLGVTGHLMVQSDSMLARRISKRTGMRVKPVPELDGLENKRIDVSAFQLLLELGKATSALPLLHVSGAAGLPGLTALRTASNWAILKYLWAFAVPTPRVSLSTITDSVRLHHRTVLSEHLGIAVATHLVTKYVLANEPLRIVDGDSVEFDPTLGQHHLGLGAHRPDYFFYTLSNTGIGKSVICEVKGTSSGRHIDQLCRGVDQVAAPADIAGVNTRRLVIACSVQGRRLRAFAIEVDKPTFGDRREALARVLRRPGRLTPATLSGIHRGPVGSTLLETIEPTEQDIESIESTDNTRLFAMAGIDPSIDGPLSADTEDPRFEVIGAQGSDFVCRRWSLGDNGDTTLLTGLESSIAAAASDQLRRPAAKSELLRTVRARLSEMELPQRPLIERGIQDPRPARAMIDPSGYMIALVAPREQLARLDSLGG